MWRQVEEKVWYHVFWKFPLLAWAAWQLQFSPAAWGSLRKHVAKPFLQPAAPLCKALTGDRIRRSAVRHIRTRPWTTRLSIRRSLLTAKRCYHWPPSSALDLTMVNWRRRRSLCCHDPVWFSPLGLWRASGQVSSFLEETSLRCTVLRIPSFSIFCYVVHREFRGPAWAVGSYSIGPPVCINSQKHSTKYCEQGDAQRCKVEELWCKAEARMNIRGLQ